MIKLKMILIILLRFIKQDLFNQTGFDCFLYLSEYFQDLSDRVESCSERVNSLFFPFFIYLISNILFYLNHIMVQVQNQ